MVDVQDMPRGGKREGAGYPARVKGEKTTMAGARFTAAELARIDAHAARVGCSRSDVIRRLIEFGFVPSEAALDAVEVDDVE